MKIPAKDIEQFIAKIPKAIKAILLYGPDNGLVRFRANFFKKNRSLAGELTYEQIKNNPSVILDSLNSISLFGEDLSLEKNLLIEFTGTSLADPCLSIIKSGEYNGLIICCAGELGPDSSLRKFFESSPLAAAIPCYKDDSVGIAKIIQKIFKEQQLTYEASLIPMLLNYIAVGDRSLILHEIEKIILFMGNKKHISIEDIEGYLDRQGEVTFEKLCYQISLRKAKDLEFYLNRLLSEGHNLVAITRMIMYHFHRLYQVKLLIEQGKSETAALESLSPPIFFKQIGEFTQSLNLWTKSQISEMLKQLVDLEFAAKQTSMPATLILRRIMLSVCS